MQKIKSYEDYAREILGVTEPDKLDKYQKQKNRIDYQRYAANYMAEQNKNTQIAELDKAKEKSLAESAIASERARQYVDAVNKHYGIAGTGYGESRAIDLYSEAAKRRQEINDNYDKEKNDALTAYQNAITKNELNASGSMAEIEGYEDEANEAKRQEYVMKLQELADNPGVSKEDFTKYYEAYKGYLGEDDALLAKDLEAKASKYAMEKAQNEQRATVANSHGVKLGDAITLDELVQKSKKFLDTGEQTELINLITNLAQTQSKNGKSLLDDKAFDINFGYGNEHYYYKDGVFYDISKADARKFEIVNVEKEAKANKLMRELPSKESFADLNYKDKIYLISDYQKYLSEEQKKQLPDYIKNSVYW